ncbi:MAG: arylsulfatase [Pseudomonadota bacterium]
MLNRHLAAGLAALLCSLPLCAQQGAALPLPAAAFKGSVGATFADSRPDFPQPVKAAKGAPNVVLILLDDVGFGQPGTFGGPVPTPALDQLAARGLRYNRFHTVGVCSPTRAALLTGRNHHQVAAGTVSELSTGYPGYNSVWPRSAASVARVLEENGYATAAWGKWHNTPDWETSPLGPFTRWPTGLGFQYWYGFHGGETSAWEPQLFRNQIPVEPAKSAAQGYHLTTDLVDDAIGWIDRKQSIAPDKPYFIYFAPGAAHAPLHAPKEWIAKFKGQFDQGWDMVREQTLARQKQLGLVPANTKLTARPDVIEAWDKLSPDARRLYARHMEVFAGYLAHTDHEIGRLLAAVHRQADADNTLVIYVVGDNGPAAEGSPTGTLNSMMVLNGIPDNVPAQLAKLDEIGGPLHENHYPVGWAWAGAAPFQWMKRVPSHFGATRNGMVIDWPAAIKDHGAIRTQFHHVIDVVPTIYRAAGITAPSAVDGVAQTPIAGVDMGYSFNAPQAKGTRTLQYFETEGRRAIYQDGWIASASHSLPWTMAGTRDFKSDVWELYDIDADFSQSDNLAAARPDKLKEMVALFDQEAQRYSVLPLDDRMIERAGGGGLRPSVVRGRTSFTYRAGTTRIPEGSAPPVYQRSHKITAKISVPPAGVQGVIVAEGGSAAGFTLYVKDGRVHYDYNFFGRAIYSVVSDASLPAGEVVIVMDYQQRPFRPLRESTGGTATLYINGRQAGQGEIKNAVPGRFSITETLDIGMDLGSPVSEAYRAAMPFAFSGTIHSVTIDVAPTQPLILPSAPAAGTQPAGAAAPAAATPAPSSGATR